MSLELFNIDEVKVTFANHVTNLVLDDSGVMRKQLEYVLRGEVLRMRDKIGSEGVPCTPDTVRSLLGVAKEFEEICFPTYKVCPEAEISTKLGNSDDFTTVTVVVHIKEDIDKTTPKNNRLYPTASNGSI